MHEVDLPRAASVSAPSSCVIFYDAAVALTPAVLAIAWHANIVEKLPRLSAADARHLLRPARPVARWRDENDP
jgi:hypothetical protein